jgi:hypothetical protein
VSIATGTLVTVAWNVMGFETDAVYPALAVSVASLVLVSLATAPPPAEKWRPFFAEEKAAAR